MTMLPSLRGIANKARGEKQYRFRHLYTMLNVDWLRSCWSSLNKKAAAGVDRVTAREYGKNLSENLRDLVGCGRAASYPTPPAQIPACGFPARGSSVTLASDSARIIQHQLTVATFRDPGLRDLEVL